MKMTTIGFAAALAIQSSCVFAAGGGGGSGSGSSGGGAGSTSSGNGAPSVTTSPGTNSLGTAQSSGEGTRGNSRTVGRSGAASGGRIDGTATKGPALPGDNTIRQETSPNSKADQMIKGICKGC